MAPTQEQMRATRAKVLSGKKPAKARIQRYLKSVESKLEEGAKNALLLKGTRCSQAMGTVLKDMRSMLAPHAKLLTKKNAIVAFDSDGQRSLEFLATKNDCSLFALASTNKKRPNKVRDFIAATSSENPRLCTASGMDLSMERSPKKPHCLPPLEAQASTR